MFGQHLAALDAAVFAHLSDDTAAIWSRPGAFDTTVAALFDRVEQAGSIGGMSVIDFADVVRISVAEVEVRRPGQSPQSGDLFIVGGVQAVVHGEPWRDAQQNGRDWLCPVSR
ncbi:head-tail joining protein [Brevundimonas sp. DWR2-3-1b1]|uniref:head-tail joining protein n=1 Tax=unclassified Brevundimonas TaxID=2622653 RepID=UPI003CEA407F